METAVDVKAMTDAELSVWLRDKFAFGNDDWNPCINIQQAMEDVVPAIQRDGVVSIIVGEPAVEQTTVRIWTDAAAPGGGQLLGNAYGPDKARAICEAAYLALNKRGDE